MICRVLLCLSLIPSVAMGATWYVDNERGSDDGNGTSQATAFATIAKALAASATSDTISLTKTATPYYESITLSRHGGTPQKPFTIEGNGAVLSGLKQLEAGRWKQVGDDLYFYAIEHSPYGNPYLACNGKKLAEGTAADALKADQFFWDRDAGVYFRCAAGKQPASYDLSATLVVSGFATVSSSYIVCRNLISECFSNDGFNMHGDCRGIYLENVVARYNGDDGISIHETGGLVVRNAHVHHNMFGVQDVNAARSFYNGVLSEHNHVGASFHGGAYSLVDCQIRDNDTYQIEIVGEPAKHLIGSQYNRFSQTTLFAGNVLISGTEGQAGLRISDGAHAVLEHSVISGLRLGINVRPKGTCHLTTSVITDCGHAIFSESDQVFRDYNVYFPFRMHWLGTEYGPSQWPAFREAALHDEHSQIGPVTIGAGGIVSFPEDSPAGQMRKPIGPTAAITFDATP